MTRLTFAAVALAALAPAAPLLAQEGDWPTFNGNLAAQKYSPATQITPENVGDLELAWEFETGDVSDGSGELPTSVWSATPILANDTLYLGTPFYRVFALDPGTGEVRWSYNTDSTLEALTQPALKSRGVTYWEAETPVEGEPCQKRVYMGTMDSELHALDADTGELCTDFGDDGILLVNKWNDVNAEWPLSLLQPPTAYGDQLFVGWAGADWEYSVASPGTVFAIDARTGERNWQVDFIPREIRDRTGTANVWASMSVDEERGILYLPVSSPSPNYYGGMRTEPIELATSVTAVDTETGEIIWSRQLVHHDIWDYDTGSAPTLVDLQVNGETVPALVQSTKQSMLYVLNRETGEPIFDYEERPVPASDIEGEEAAPTQPFFMTPPPSHDFESYPEMSTLANLVSFGQCADMIDGMRYEGLFTPPSLEGTIVYPGTAGGMQWGGGALDPETNRYYVNTSKVVQTLTLIPREEYDELQGGSGNEQGLYPQIGSPYGFRLLNWVTDNGLPCWKPPYGTLLAYDLKTGEMLWEVPLGRSKKWGFFGPAGWGSPNIGAPVITAGGVLFIGSTMDARVHAIDPRDGTELWSDHVEAPSVANPAVYTYEGRQYVAFVAGGNTILSPEVGDQIAVYALPLDDD
ncbi:pyrroloquinoline quinone-dependent dehydrogenase [Pseudoroseicyclus tamaricis]|uniref:Pyrroloquinoline quinone-dependent dehydrogenase n=1 Tax=Pseudoroseicyclus tamaricis TaxID=2705421 RepID=A0A6B2JLF8_9RHOB|nr:pyrroloquinoline quinone-dependent dehydrogenase [Pseudoroseicyclus tamaricis]NDV02391.1 pyrroloquinoline quinone-dependent dehydrogenase [Pseudoroseicyclus tamaricis]